MTGRSATCVLATVVVISGGLAGCATENPAPPDIITPAVAAARAKAEAYERGQELAREAQRLEKDGHRDRAIELYKEAVSTYRDLPAAWLNLGLLLYQEQDRKGAAEALQVAGDLMPTDPRPWYNLGVIWEKNGYPVDASKMYDAALERDEFHLPSLRGSIKLDQYLSRATEKTAQRLRTALLIETDPTWREFFARQQIRLREVDNKMIGASPDGSS